MQNGTNTFKPNVRGVVFVAASSIAVVVTILRGHNGEHVLLECLNVDYRGWCSSLGGEELTCLGPPVAEHFKETAARQDSA